jgi:chromosome segregation ATPase
MMTPDLKRLAQYDLDALRLIKQPTQEMITAVCDELEQWWTRAFDDSKEINDLKTLNEHLMGRTTDLTDQVTDLGEKLAEQQQKLNETRTELVEITALYSGDKLQTGIA